MTKKLLQELNELAYSKKHNLTFELDGDYTIVNNNHLTNSEVRTITNYVNGTKYHCVVEFEKSTNTLNIMFY